MSIFSYLFKVLLESPSLYFQMYSVPSISTCSVFQCSKYFHFLVHSPPSRDVRKQGHHRLARVQACQVSCCWLFRVGVSCTKPCSSHSGLLESRWQARLARFLARSPCRPRSKGSGKAAGPPSPYRQGSEVDLSSQQTWKWNIPGAACFGCPARLIAKKCIGQNQGESIGTIDLLDSHPAHSRHIMFVPLRTWLRTHPRTRPRTHRSRVEERPVREAGVQPTPASGVVPWASRHRRLKGGWPIYQALNWGNELGTPHLRDRSGARVCSPLVKNGSSEQELTHETSSEFRMLKRKVIIKDRNRIPQGRFARSL